MELWVKIFLVLAGIGNLSLVLFILYRGRSSRIHLTFSVFLLCSALWIISIYFALHFAMENPDEILARILGKLTFAFGSLTLCSFLVFTEVFPMPCKAGKTRKRMLLYYTLGVAAFAFALTPFLQRNVTVTADGKFNPVFGWGLRVWSAFMLWTVVYGFYKLISKYRKLGPGHEKTQLKYTFLGLATVGVVALLVNMLVFLFGDGNVSGTAVGPSTTFFMVVLITFAIVRHRLMDLGVVFRNTLIYFIVITILVGINLVFLVFLHQLLNIPPWVSIVLSSTIVVLTLVPLRNNVERLFYKHVFKIRRHREITEELSDNLTRILDLDGLRRVVVDELVNFLQIESGSLLVLESNGERYSSIYPAPDGNSFVTPISLKKDNILSEKLQATRRMLLLDELKQTLNEDEYEIYRMEFAGLKSVALLPLMAKNVLMGMLSLGPKRSGDIYSYEDIDMLNVLGNQMATALENSRLFDEILEMKNHYGSILQHLSSGVITMRADKKINMINQRARNILNLNNSDLVGEPVERLGGVLSVIMINRQTTTEDFYDKEVVIEIPERGSVPLGIICTVMRDENDTSGVLMVVNDLTVEKQLQAKIRRADRLASIGTLAAGMAHEIKNPLVSIKTFTQLLPERFDDQDFREKFSSITTLEVERINHIVEQLLHFAKPIKPKTEPHDLHALMNEVLASLDEEIIKNGTEIVRDFTAGPAIVMIDPNQIKQVFVNLFLNSVQAIEQNGRIEIKTQYIFDEQGTTASSGNDISDRQIMVTITDSGKGIPAEILPNLFDPFFTTRSDGFGLGLAIVHGIITEHNATIEVDSEEAKWTKMTIKFPVPNNA